MDETEKIGSIAKTDPSESDAQKPKSNLDDTQVVTKVKIGAENSATEQRERVQKSPDEPKAREQSVDRKLRVYIDKAGKPENAKKESSSEASSNAEEGMSAAKAVSPGGRRYLGSEGKTGVKPLNYNIIKKAAETGDYKIEQEVAKGAESVLYSAEVGGYRVCVKAIRSKWNRIFGDSKTRKQVEKLTNVAYRTKLRHIKNEYEVSQVLYSEKEIPLVHIYALRRVTFWGIELGYDLIMELFKGHDLGEKTVHKSLTVQDKIRVVYQCAQALDYLHKKGYIHLDIKPSNFILHNGRVKLLDFGVSVKSGYKPKAITGTGGYLSPEQICKTILDEKTDIYALGLTFAVLFGGKSLQQSQNDLLSRQFRNDAKYQLETDSISVISELPELVEESAFAQIIKDCSIPKRNMRIPTCQVLLARIKAWAAEKNFELEK